MLMFVFSSKQQKSSQNSLQPGKEQTEGRPRISLQLLKGSGEIVLTSATWQQGPRDRHGAVLVRVRLELGKGSTPECSGHGHELIEFEELLDNGLTSFLFKR